MDLGRPVSVRNPALACTMGMSGTFGSTRTKDCCSLYSGVRREVGSIAQETGLVS